MRKYKYFKIEDVLNWQPQKEIDPLKIDNLAVKSDKQYPFYGQSTNNNGIISYLSLTDNVLNNKLGKPTILIHSNNQNIVYLETPFYLKDGHGATSVLQSDFLNEKNALYLMTCIRKIITKKFSYNEKATKIALKNTLIQLPVTPHDEIDYTYMEKYIGELEKKRIKEFEEERISELEAHLKVSRLENYKLSKEEEDAINEYRKGKVNFQRFKIGKGEQRLFNVCTTKKKFNANSIKFDGKHPYVARSSINNGIRGYIDQDIIYLNDSNTISFGQDTATMFYQEKPYFTGDKIKIMSYIGKELTPELACYLISTMKKAFQNFSWGQSSFNENVLNEVEIEMPILEQDVIDYTFIKNFIVAQKKLTIKNIVDWRNREIAITKNVI